MTSRHQRVWPHVTSRVVFVLAFAAAIAIPTAVLPCGAGFEECCTRGAACGEGLTCDTTCVRNYGVDCSSSWTTSPGVCIPTSPPPAVCAPDELRCGSSCIIPDPGQMMDALCQGDSVFLWCFSDYEGPFFACPVGPIEEVGTRYACTYIYSDPLNCGMCGVVCPDGTTCKLGECQ